MTDDERRILDALRQAPNGEMDAILLPETKDSSVMKTIKGLKQKRWVRHSPQYAMFYQITEAGRAAYFAYLMKTLATIYEAMALGDNAHLVDGELWRQFQDLQKSIDMDWSIKRDGKQVNLIVSISVVKE